MRNLYGRYIRKKKLFLRCSPVLVPQMTEGEFPFGLVTLNVSVRH